MRFTTDYLMSRSQHDCPKIMLAGQARQPVITWLRLPHLATNSWYTEEDSSLRITLGVDAELHDTSQQDLSKYLSSMFHWL